MGANLSDGGFGDRTVAYSKLLTSAEVNNSKGSLNGEHDCSC